MKKAALLATLLASPLLAATASGVPKVNIDAQAITGLSAGAFAAVQYHVAFSSELVGAGIIAGGPFYCAGDSETTAITACMNIPSEIDISSSESAAEACAKGGVCDPLSNLAKQRVWLYSGTSDTVVKQGVMVKLQSFYEKYMPSAAVVTKFDIPSEHSWVTQDYGNSCGTLGSPYINSCSYDASSAMMATVLGRSLSAPVTANQKAFYSVSQDSYTPGGVSAASISLGPTAYVYAPDACVGGANCTLVTVLHGCQQTVSDIGNDFIQHIGMNEVAEANNLVVLYPQAIKSYYAPSNPEGCFDWWGYTDSNYSNKKGAQMSTIHAMTEAIVKGPSSSPSSSSA